MKLSEDEYGKVNEAISKLQEMYNDQMEKHVTPRAEAVDSQFVQLMREKYLTVTGLGDLLEDYGLLVKNDDACSNGCSAPCEMSCVSPCTSACNSATYDIGGPV